MTRERLESFGMQVKRIVLGLGLAGIGVLIGLYLLAPRMAQASDTYLPRVVAQLPAGAVQLTNPDGTTSLLPVRLAETMEARRMGFANTGPQAMETLFMLYGHPRELNRLSYTMSGLRAPLELAVINAEGNVVDIRRVEPGQATVVINMPHRWVLAAREGLLAQYGVIVDTAMDPDNIHRKVLLASTSP